MTRPPGSSTSAPAASSRPCIPGSYNVPLDDLGEHGATIATIDEPVVLVCLSGGRASKAEAALAGLGMANLHVLDGGITAWEQQGYDVRRGATGRWSLERQVRLVAGSVVLTAILASTVVPPMKWLAGAFGFGLTFAALQQHLRHGHAAGQAALQPHRQLQRRHHGRPAPRRRRRLTEPGTRPGAHRAHRGAHPNQPPNHRNRNTDDRADP
ncbi:MAG: rhodanese-like domain-containing protein [Acidimicrobiales bacterium]